jgi:TolB-like protein/Tfp pilus assembly protein PilF
MIQMNRDGRQNSVAALIESVADGGVIDWEEVEASAADEQQRRLIGHLRLVAGVSEVHRTTPSEELSVSPLPSSHGTGALRQWGHLLLLEQIGQGTFGEVYRARDLWLDCEVALKLLRAGSDGNVPAGTLDEPRRLALLRHPNVVRVYGADMHDGRVGLWMEFVRGRTLSTMLAEHGPWSANEAAVVGQEICRALAAVHGAGLVHGDVKAQNVMRESGGRFVLMDFGAGRFSDGRPAVGTRPAGTPLYLAPEVLQGGQPSVQSDLYALGVLLYLLVTGSYPVQGASMEQLIAAHAAGQRRNLRDARPDLPDSFVEAVECALDPDPRRRFATAGDMLAVFTRADFRHGAAHGSAATPTHAASPRARWTVGFVAGVCVLALAGALTYWWLSRTQSGVAHAAVQLVAVLPFQDLSGTDAYLADGLTESLTQELSTAGPLKVTARTSVARLIAQNVTLPQIARTLNADAVIEGSILKTGPDVRVNVRVIQAGSNAAMWASSFDRSSSDLASLQRDIAGAIASALQLALYPRAVERWQQQGRIDDVAYDAYLRGRFERRKATQAATEAALEEFRRSAARDPKYAPPRAAMAECYLRLGQDFASMPAAEAGRLAKAAVGEALEIDANLASAHSVLAAIRYQVDWDFGAAEQQFERAIQLDPSAVETRLEYAAFLSSRGRSEDALQQLSLARELDPLSPGVADIAARVYYHARQYDRAIAELRRAIDLEPTSNSAYLGLGRVYSAMGRYDEAIAEYTRASKDFAGHPYFEAEIAQVEIAAGRTAQGRRRLAALRSQYGRPGSQVTPYMLALTSARLDRDEAFAWLEREFAVQSLRVLALKVDPRADPLRSDPRYGALVRKLGLEP